MLCKPVQNKPVQYKRNEEHNETEKREVKWKPAEITDVMKGPGLSHGLKICTWTKSHFV